MNNQLSTHKESQRPGRYTAMFAALLAAAMMSACANYAGIGSDSKLTAAADLQQAQSLATAHGNWPAANWANQFGDAQLATLINEALKSSPTLAEAQARLQAAAAFTEEARAQMLPKVGADYAYSRQQYSSTALVPPPYAGSWQSENKAVVSASYELDVWGKNSAAWKSSVSKLRAAEAEQEKVKLTLSAAVAVTYNELARLTALRDLAQQEVQTWQGIADLAQRRLRSGLDTETEQQGAQRNLATARSGLTALDGRMLDTRYQLSALLGQGPDRGLLIKRPELGLGDTVTLPDNLPADLVARRPDLTAARWRVDALTHGIDVAKADFYPNINLGAAIGLDAFGFGRFLNAASRTASAGPAIHIPIFDAGALRARLKERYADYDLAVAAYNGTLVSALSDIATQLARIRSGDAQLVDARLAAQAASRSWKLADSQYRGGLSSQTNVLQARLGAVAAEQAIVNLGMNRRSQQIALAAALGGGFVAPADHAD
jgi:NodT family efflux transporter outer membrane factor (OMF) lipoprotein